MSENSTEVVRKSAADEISWGGRGVELSRLGDVFRFAGQIIKSGLAPKGIDTPEKAMIAMQYGAELGFSPMRSLSVITVVNGKPGIYGEAALAKINQSDICTLPPVIRREGEGDARRAVIRFQRRSMLEPVEVSFSVAEAKRAKLWQKAGPWTDYPDDMLQWRAVARMSKAYFSDVLLGLPIAEELRDYPAQETPRPSAPPAEPDPLLTMPEAVTPEPEPDVAEAEIGERRVSSRSAPKPKAEASIDDDEAALVRAVEKLENRIVGAETVEDINRAWTDAQPTLDKLNPKEQQRLTKLYRQNVAGLQKAAR